MKCPKCGSENVSYNASKKTYACFDCMNFFEENQKTEIKNDEKRRVFLSYGHDKNAYIVDRIKSDLEKNGYDVWIDKSRIKSGDDWRKSIYTGLVNSYNVIAFLSEHSVRKPGVCLDELKIALNVKGANIKTVLLEPEYLIKPPAYLSNAQWLDMSEWNIRHTNNQTDDFEVWYKEKYNELLNVIESNDAIEFNGDIKVLKQKLSPYLNLEKENSLLDKFYTQREWLNEEIEKWVADKNSKVLMIYGDPGSGKSAFCVNYSYSEPKVCACFLCEWNKEDSINPHQIIRTLAFDLATKMPDYRRYLINMLGGIDNLNKLDNETLFDFLLSKPLFNLVDGNRDSCIIVVDGLDEAEDNRGDNPIAKVFETCAQNLPTWVKIIATSRPEYNVKKYFQSYDSIDLVKDMPHGYNDIKAYLLTCLKDELNSVNNKLETIDHIAELAEGSFLYVVNLVNDLKSGVLTLADLNSIPKGLYSFYRLSMQRKFGTRNDFYKIEPFFKLLVISESIPEEIIVLAGNNSGKEYFDLLSKIGSWVNRYKEDGLYVLSFSHKSIRDWLVNSEKNLDYYIDPISGARDLVKFCKAQIENNYKDICDDLLKNYIKNHIGNYYLFSNDFSGFEQFMIARKDDLDPIWRFWNQFPNDWDHKQLIGCFWCSDKRNDFLQQLQKEGNTKYLLWIFELLKGEYKIENFDRTSLQIYIDIIHLSGRYEDAVNIIDDYLQKYTIEEITNDKFLIKLKARRLHHAAFFTPSRRLSAEAIDLYNKANPEYVDTIYELLLFIASKYWLTNDWEESIKWMRKSKEYAIEHKLMDFCKRSRRGIAMYYYHHDNYNMAIEEIPEEIKNNLDIKSRYDAYLLCVLANVYTCMNDKEDLALKCYNKVLQYTISNGINGWIAHSYLGIANVNYKLKNYAEAIDFANRANKIYTEIKQQWGIIMSGALLAFCADKLQTKPIEKSIKPFVELATKLDFESCVASINEVIEKKSNCLKLYWV